MQEKKIPVTSVVAIVIALISSRILRDTTEWNVLVVSAVSIAIAIALTIVIIFIGGMIVFFKEDYKKQRNRS